MDIPAPPPPEDTPKSAPEPGDPFAPPPPPPAPVAPAGESAPAGPRHDQPPPGVLYGPPPGSPYGPPPPGAGYEPLPPYPGGPYGPQPAYGPGPYGGYGWPPPHPGGPQGWYPYDPSTNGLAIASLVTAFTCVPFLGAILGVAGLRQIGRRGQQGRGLAIAGLIINSVATLLVALFIGLGVAGVLDEGNTKVSDLAAGQCFNTVGRSLSSAGGSGASSATVDVVSCDHAHDAEAYDVFDLPDSLGPDYPGSDRISQVAGPKCTSAADSYLGGKPLPHGVRIYSYIPPANGWAHGYRWVICFFGSTSEKLHGSVKDGGQNAGVGV
ncbi:DUF4190 domain-containing protein [Actinacidiphila acididurans]|uniref:DUF4190 domain-containing protein n=1 Tax=Actinacidiphila acididurans TaxID=2784346 RepID=A0ABS2TWR9_9ACTN|nr:DUF4190 domain-containing protein [Actinacidiphila acididurans]MBM9507784.1 DUF4190 domain-containing protein [Actinacidiphila acididurans]